MRKILLFLACGVALHAQPPILDVTAHAKHSTGFTAYAWAEYWDDTAKDATLTTGFRVGDIGSLVTQIEISSTAGFVIRNAILVGNDWAKVLSIDSPTLMTVAFHAGTGGVDWSEAFMTTVAAPGYSTGFAFTCSGTGTGNCVATTASRVPSWWTAGHRLFMYWGRSVGLRYGADPVRWDGSSGGFVIAARTDDHHFTFTAPSLSGTYNYSTDPSLWVRSDGGQLHSVGEKVTNIGTEARLCWGTSTGVYSHEAMWQLEFVGGYPDHKQQEIHTIVAGDMPVGATIYWKMIAKQRQRGAPSCSAIDSYTGSSAEQVTTLLSEGADPLTPAPPQNVSFSTAAPTVFAQTLTLGVSPGCSTLQACMNTAAAVTPGNVKILLPEGSDTTAQVTFPTKTAGNGIIQIRSAATDGNLPALGDCKPGGTECISKGSYIPHIAILRKSGVNSIFTVADGVGQPVGWRIGPGIRFAVDASTVSTAGGYPFINLNHSNAGGSQADHNLHAKNFVVDRNIFDGGSTLGTTNSAISVDGYENLAIVDNVFTRGFGNVSGDASTIQIDGQDNADSGVIIRGNHIAVATMAIYGSDNAFQNHDWLIENNEVYAEKQNNTTYPEFLEMQSYPVAAITTGSDASITLSLPAIWLSTANPPTVLSITGATGGAAVLNRTDWNYWNGLSSFSCTSPTCTAYIPSHGLQTGNAVYLSGGGFNCRNLAAINTITRTDADHFTFASGGYSGTCISGVTISGPVWTTNARNPGANTFSLVPALDTVSFGGTLGGPAKVKAGSFKDQKNMIEFKVGDRMELRGNIIHDAYSVLDQPYACFTLTTSAFTSGGVAPLESPVAQATVSNINFHNNWCYRADSALAFGGTRYQGGSTASQRILLENNLYTDMGADWCGGGGTCGEAFFTLGPYWHHFSVLHNTYVHPGAKVFGSGSAVTPPGWGDVTMMNNIMSGTQMSGPNNSANEAHYGAQNWLLPTTTGSCHYGVLIDGQCWVADRVIDMNWGGNAHLGNNRDFGAYDNFSAGKVMYAEMSSGVFQHAKDPAGRYQSFDSNYWPRPADMKWQAQEVITAATNTSPITITISGTWKCQPQPQDRVWISQVIGTNPDANQGANGTFAVLSSTSNTAVLAGSAASYAYVSGGVLMPLSGTCDSVANWKLSTDSPFKAGSVPTYSGTAWTNRIGPTTYTDRDEVRVDANGVNISVGSGPAMDGAAVGANIDALSAAIAGVCVLGPSTLPGATVSQSYSQHVIGTGCNTSTYTISAGSLPSGLSISDIGDNTGAITGTVGGSPTTASFTVTYDGANQPYFVVVSARPSLSGTLPHATQGSAYSQSITRAGGTGTVTCAITSGSLTGSGITLSSTCALTGTAGTPGTYTANVIATDANNVTSVSPYSLALVVDSNGPVLSTPILLRNVEVVGTPVLR